MLEFYLGCSQTDVNEIIMQSKQDMVMLDLTQMT